MSVRDVCRLCLATDNLVWIFDKRIQNPDNMKEVIFITTGVEIAERDTVSQKICSKCCHITLKMFKFRSNAAKIDKELKAKCMELVTTIQPEVSFSSNTKIKKERLEEIPLQSSNSSNASCNTSTNKISTIHNSITDLLKLYPKIKLPTGCVEFDISPFVMLEPQATVKQYLRRQRRRRKLLARKQKQHVNGIRKYLLEKPNNSENVNQSLSEVATAGKVHLAKKKTTQVFTSISNNQSKVRAKDIPATVVSNRQRSDIQTSDHSEPPMKMMKLNDSKSVIKSVTLAPTSSNNPILRDSLPLTNIENANLNVESVGLASTPSNDSPIRDGQPLSNIEKSNKLFVCKVCNSIHNCRKSLRSHQRKHIKCHLCKRNLKTMSERDAHLKECTNLKTMPTLQKLLLSKEESDDAQKKNSDRSIKINEESETKEEKEAPKGCSLLRAGIQTLTPLSPTKKNYENVIDISEDDDFEIPRPQIKLPESAVSLKNVLLPQTLSPIKNVTSLLNTTQHDHAHSNYAASDCATANPTYKYRNLSEGDSSLTSSHNEKWTEKESLPKMSNVGVIKPDVKISSEHFVDTQVGSDVQVLRGLLKCLKHKSINEIPSNNTILSEAHSKLCIFKNLKHKLPTYKIPVRFRSGVELCAQYNSSPTSPKSTFQNNYWHDLQLIKFIATPKSMPDLNQINISTVVAPSTHNANNASTAGLPPSIHIRNIAEASMLHLTTPDQSFGSSSAQAMSTTATATVDNVVPISKPIPPYSSKQIQNQSSIYQSPLSHSVCQTQNSVALGNITPSQGPISNRVNVPNTIHNGLLAVPTTNYNPTNRNVSNYSFSFSKITNIPPTLNLSYAVTNATQNSWNNSIANTAASVELNNNRQIQLTTVTPQPKYQNINNLAINRQFNLVVTTVTGPTPRGPLYAPPRVANTSTGVTTANQYKTGINTAKEFTENTKQGTIRVRNIADLT